MKCNMEERPAYPAQSTAEDDIITKAMEILEARLRGNIKAAPFAAPDDIKRYLMLHNAKQADPYVERFGVLFLDVNHRLIEHQIMFTGTLNQTSVYPREVVRAALRLNASSVVLTHNHPSGSATPSRADDCLTRTLKDALALIDVRVIDHIIVGDAQALSMAEKGLI
jgi:DNA repair protein RadC